ncbi:MAG: hypothetical protein JXQ96_18665 [Cyclobacteriaceae bacterium]
MIKIPTFSGKIQEKDNNDIFYWAFEKSPAQRLEESWRLHCANHNIDPQSVRLDKSKSSARKRDG